MSKTWIIADTHFHHNKLVELCNRPEDFTDRIVKNWCKLVKPKDVVFHLGDVGFYKKKDCGDLLNKLPGLKILIRGNHDRYPVKWYMDNGFLAVMESAVVNVCFSRGRRGPNRHGLNNHYFRVLLSHIPMPVPEGVDFNLHGHFHNNGSTHWEEPLVEVLTPKHRLVSVEECQYQPVWLGWGLHHEKFINSYQRAKEIRGV